MYIYEDWELDPKMKMHALKTSAGYVNSHTEIEKAAAFYVVKNVCILIFEINKQCIVFA